MELDIDALQMLPAEEAAGFAAQCLLLTCLPTCGRTGVRTT